MDLTSLIGRGFIKQAERTDSWTRNSDALQRDVLRSLLERGRNTVYGRRHDFASILRERDFVSAYRYRVPDVEYEEMRPLVMRMIKGEKDLLWPGRCRDFAQSSGTSGGKSKFIPITEASLQGNHYRGGSDAVAHYLR
ncbi:MAG: GH3 auxin-responsive promoter family protein, partial [Muribaculaceae bacterium]|nr:GH3 auxin-responsive promoter family protein [Muribaculaceae bacterium]